MKKLLSVLLVATLFAGCSSDEKKSSANATEDRHETKGSGDNHENATPSQVQTTGPNGTPESVMTTIFKAAATGEVEGLQVLLPPDGEGGADGDCKALCNPGNESMKAELRRNYMTLEEFQEAFSKAKIVGQPIIEGDQAKVHFLFGPNPQRKETMNMQRISEKWYLKSF